MILVFEMTWSGGIHAPGNSATIQTIARAYPREAVCVFADRSHIAELQADRALTACANVSFRQITLYPRLFGKTHIVSWGRFRRELSTLRQGLATVPRGEPCLIMLISATPTAILAARLLSRLRRGRTGVQVGLHGNLNDINAWRPRNPLTRACDLRSVLNWRHPEDFTFLVLEEGIRLALVEAIPRIADHVQVLPLPINATELTEQSTVELQEPLRIGLVGQATGAKGTDLFLAVAREFKQRYGNRVAFTLVGRAPDNSDLAAFDVLEDPVTTERLARKDYLARLAKLHFVFLPLDDRYYRLSASGALIDAITWLKPVIATRLPIVEALFQRHGDIGYLCDDAAAMREVLTQLVSMPDTARYLRQIEAMRRLRDSREPGVLADEYRRQMQQRFAGLLTD